MTLHWWVAGQVLCGKQAPLSWPPDERWVEEMTGTPEEVTCPGCRRALEQQGRLQKRRPPGWGT